MEIMIYFVLPMLGSIFLVGSMFYGAYRIAGRPQVSRFSWGVMAVYILLTVGFSYIGNTWVNLFFSCLFPFAASLAFRTARTYLAPDFILTAAVFLTDVVVLMVYEMLWVVGIVPFQSRQLAYILLLAASRMTEFMVILLVVAAVGKRAGRQTAARQIAWSVLLPLFSLFNMYCMVYLMQIYFTKTMMLLFIANLLFLIGLNVYFCVLMDIMDENRRLENEKELYRQQAAMQVRYYEREEEKYEESRKLIHDIRNHILAMEELYHAREAGDAARYAGDIHKMLNRFQQKYYTSDRLLNIILNDKVQEMQREGIREDIRVGEVSLEFMRDTDVTALFANLLDNAISAAAQSGGGYIRLRVSTVRQFLSVTLENSCDREPVKTAEGFLSNSEGHQGLGLRIIRQTVELYGGDVQFEWKNGVFFARAMLNCYKI